MYVEDWFVLHFHDVRPVLSCYNTPFTPLIILSFLSSGQHVGKERGHPDREWDCPQVQEANLRETLQTLLVGLSHYSLRHCCHRGSCDVSCKPLFFQASIAELTLPLRILVAVPKIAQSKINEAKLEIQSVRILDTESDAYLMEIDSSITTDGKIHAKVDPFEADMYLEDWPAHVAFATVKMPETNSNKHQVVNVSQQVTITDMEEFTRFNVWFHNNETVRVTVYGKTKVKPSGLSRKYGVTFKKTLELKGLNHFAGTEVNDGHIGFGSGKDGPNFNGTTTIPNASVFTLDNVSYRSQSMHLPN